MATPSWLRALDFTDEAAPLGGIVREGLGRLPGGQTALGVVDAANAARRGTTTRDTPTDRGGGTAPAARPSSSAPWYQKPAVLIGAGLAVVVLLVGLIFIRRK